MSDVTAGEVEREMERAHALAASEGLCDWWGGAEEDHSTPCSRIATALAIRAREVRREALKNAASAVEAEQLHEIIDDESDRGYRNGIEDATAAIRALMRPGE